MKKAAVYITTALITISAAPALQALALPDLLGPEDDAGTGGDAGDSFDEATLVPTGVVFDGARPGLDDLDVYAFDVPEGASIHLMQQSTSCWYLHAPNLTEVDDACASAGDGFGNVRVDAAAGGRWYLASGSGGGMERYRLSIGIDGLAPSPLGLPLEQDDAGSGGDAGATFRLATPIAPGRVLEGELDYPMGDEDDVYSFAVPDGARISVSGTGMYGCASLYAPNLTEARTFCESGGTELTETSVLDVVGGTWYVAFQGLAYERYRFSVGIDESAIAPAPFPEGAQDDAGSGGDAPDSLARAVRVAEGVVYEARMTGGINDDADVFAIDAPAGAIVSLRSTLVGGCAELVPPGGAVEDDACIEAAQLDPRDASSPVAGTWHVRFEANFYEPEAYSFAIALTREAPSIWPVDAPAHSDAGSGRDAPESPHDPVPIAPGVVYEGLLASAPQDLRDVYGKIPVLAGQRIEARMVPATGEGCIALHDETGAEVDLSCAVPDIVRVVEAVAERDGLWTIDVGKYGATAYWFSYAIDAPAPDPSPVDAGFGAPAQTLAPVVPATQEGEHVVVAVVDTGINPYHGFFAAPALADHPSTWLDGFPADATSLALDLGNPDLAAALAADDTTWQAVERVQTDWLGDVDEVPLYTIPGTRIVGAVSFGEYVEADPAGIEPSVPPRAIFDDDGHGTHSAGLAAGANLPEADGNVLVVMVEVDGGTFEEGLYWAAQQPWIDVISVSAGPPANAPVDLLDHMTGAIDTAMIARAVRESGKTWIVSAGNGFDSFTDTPDRCMTYTSPEKGNPVAIRIGAAEPDDGNPTWWHCAPPDAIARTNVPSPRHDSLDEASTATGTSASAPNAAGHLARLLLDARRGGLDPVSRDAAQHLLNASEPASPGVHLYAVPSTEQTAPVDQGYGLVDAAALERARETLLSGSAPRPRPDRDAWAALDADVRRALWDPDEGAGYAAAADVPQDDAGSGRDAGATRETAAPIEPGVTYRGLAAVGDADAFAFDAAPGDRIRVGWWGNVCMRVQTPSDAEVDGTCIVDNAFNVTRVEVSTAGRWVVAFESYAGTASPYEFAITLDDTPPPVPTYVDGIAALDRASDLVDAPFDAWAAMQDDADTGADAGGGFDDATPIEAGRAYRGFVDGFVADGVDVYRFDAAAGQAVEVVARGSLGCVTLHGPDEALRASACSTADQAASLSWEADAAGTWYLSYDSAAVLNPDFYTFAVGLDAAAPEVPSALEDPVLLP